MPNKHGTAFVYTVHELKIIPMYFDDVLTNRKMFEVRKNDRDFHVGDKLILREYEDGVYTGRVCKRWVQYVFHGTGLYGLQPGYCVLGISEDINDANKPT